MQSRLDTPIDDQHLTRRPHPRPAATMVTLAPLRLCLGNQPAEVPRRPGIAGRPGLRQQPLRRDPPRRLLHPLRNQIPHLVEIASPTRPHRQPTGLIRLDDPAHRLVGGAADLRSPPIAAHVSIGGDHIHPFPRVLQWRSPSAAPVTGFDTVTVSRGRASTTTTRRTKSGNFHWPPAGTATWPPVGTFSWPRTRAVGGGGVGLLTRSPDASSALRSPRHEHLALSRRRRCCRGRKAAEVDIVACPGFPELRM